MLAAEVLLRALRLELYLEHSVLLVGQAGAQRFLNIWFYHFYSPESNHNRLENLSSPETNQILATLQSCLRTVLGITQHLVSHSMLSRGFCLLLKDSEVCKYTQRQMFPSCECHKHIKDASDQNARRISLAQLWNVNALFPCGTDDRALH